MSAYYNEFDPKAAAWLRELIKRGLIADGEVDTRSIEDVSPDDLRHFTQCHFFAGIGGWSVALRLAGWADDRPIWTGSCPCQPFSSAGKGGGFADERHLWPAFFHLIGQCRPAVIAGEQVASKDGLAWFDLVRADLEGTGHAVGAADLCAASVGAPHIRQRLYWVADGAGSGRQGSTGASLQRTNDGFTSRSGDVRGQFVQPGWLAHDHGVGRGEQRGDELLDRERTTQWHDADRRGADDVAGHSLGARLEGHGRDQAARGHRPGAAGSTASAGGACFWTPADWLPCRDGKWRPVEPGTFPLAHGLPARVGRLRGYGNAIVPQVAATFVEAYLDTLLA